MTHTQEEADAELREQIESIGNKSISECADAWNSGAPNYDFAPMYAEIMAAVQAHNARIRDEAFKHGQRVGQYQAADKLYRHITSIYLFRDGDKKATAIADSNATDLLKDCEKYLNHNRKTYYSYVEQLSPIQPNKQDKP